jgi:hypothetical protein
MADSELGVCRVRCLHLNKEKNKGERSGWGQNLPWSVHWSPSLPILGCASRFYPLKLPIHLEPKRVRRVSNPSLTRWLRDCQSQSMSSREH